MSVLTKLNHFVPNEHDVYCDTPTVAKSFDYSDGQATEIYLDEVLSSVTDLSSESKELHDCIRDWPSEYHLSGLRANLLKPLDLGKAKRVLELGCGCGAISRYLGELGIEVDAVEGSPVRAKLAAKRCQDLPNVTVSTANFNDLELPKNYYDAVLYIGVTEYAGRFSDAQSDQAAVVNLLQNARSATHENGQVVIAIENRLGLKYLMGAHEDHYALPFVGVDGYPESQGIRTYDYEQWLELLDQSGLPNSKFLLPFPDYKIPTVILSDQAAGGNDGLSSSIAEKLARGELDWRSYDYSSDFSIGPNETYIWQGIAQAGCLHQFANSYLIVAGSNENAFEDWPQKESHAYYDYAQLYPDNDYSKYLKNKAGAAMVNEQAMAARIRNSEKRIANLSQQLKNADHRLDQYANSKGIRWTSGVRKILRAFGLAK
jgi:SAM-dependent methyltransferase